jgi:hypothetical protein
LQKVTNSSEAIFHAKFKIIYNQTKQLTCRVLHQYRPSAQFSFSASSLFGADQLTQETPTDARHFPVCANAGKGREDEIDISPVCVVRAVRPF